jgi:PAS domain S-box-containing protein
MSRRSISLRRAILIVVAIGLLLPALLISGYSLMQRYHDDIEKRTRDLLQQDALVLATGMQNPLWNLNHESAAALIDAMAANDEDIIRVEVRDKTLGVLARSEHPERRGGFTARTEVPVTYQGALIGTVDVEIGSTRLHRELRIDFLKSIAELGAQALLSVVLILLLLDRRFVRPLRRLGDGVERLANYQLDVPFTWKGLDEIGLLARRLEDTRISLRSLIKELDWKNRALEKDLAQRERMEQELHDREERYRLVVAKSPIAIIEWDQNFCVREWNDAAERIFGYSRRQAIGQHSHFIFPPSEVYAVDAQFRQLASSKSDGHRVSQSTRADGSLITCKWTHTHVVDENGRSTRLSIAEDITEQRRMEEARVLSEAKFAGAFACNPDAVLIASLRSNAILDINAAAEKAMGFKRQEVLGKSTIDLGVWINDEERRAFFHNVADNKSAINFECSLRTKSGDIKQFIINCTVFSVGVEEYLLAVLHDVTEQRQLQTQKAEADRALRRLAQGTQDIAGESFFELLITDLASALHVSYAVIGLHKIDPDSKATKIHSIAAYKQGHLLDQFEYFSAGTPCNMTLKGEFSLIEDDVQERFPQDRVLAENGLKSYAGAPLFDAKGSVIGVISILDERPMRNPDLVKSLLQVFSERASAELERKRAEERLRASQQRLSLIFERSPVALFVCEVGGIIHDVNLAFERLFLRDRRTVIGKTTAELGMYCDLKDRETIVQELEQTGMASSSHDIWMIRGDGSRILVQYSGHVFQQGSRTFDILACVDITEKRRIEREILDLNATLEQRVAARTEELQRANTDLATTLETLRFAQEELVRSEKLAALGSLVAGVAHELNTPIGNSLMVASTLVDQTKFMADSYASGLKRSTLEKYLSDTDKASDILVRNLHRAANLITGFKQVAADQTSSQRRRFQLSEVVSENLLTLWPTLKKKSFTIAKMVPENLELDSYPGPLGQVLTNLVNNALVHGFDNRDSGTVAIEAHPVGNDWVELSVKDDGAGIPQANLSRIFDPFFTTKMGSGGTGIGLNITYSIVTNLLGGQIHVQSEVGRGTTFVITLPVVAPQKQLEDGLPKSKLSLV